MNGTMNCRIYESFFFAKRMVDILVTGIVTVQRSLIFCMLSLLYR